MSLKSKFVGDKAFYKLVGRITIPIVIQSLITNFVNLLDNIMVGQVGTAQMSGVAIANQLMFVFNLAVFGALSGIGIFTAQYFGSGDDEGARQTMRIKLAVCVILLAIFYVLAIFFGEPLIQLFLKGEGNAAEVEITLAEGHRYLNIMLIGLVPFTLSQVYSSTLKESGETKLPMVAGIVAVTCNLVGNYILIFGNFGAPKLGVAGAAYATLISRFVEAGIILITAHRHPERYPFLPKLYRSMKVEKRLLREVALKGTPLMINELLWSLGLSAITQSYSTRGLAAVAAINITTTVFHMFSTVYFSLGSTISIIVGQALGSGDSEKAKDLDNKLIAFSLMLSTLAGIVAFILAPLFPQLYNTEAEVRDLATRLLRILACCMPISCLVHSCYFTLRTGGKTIITFLFDSFFIVVVAYPVSYVLSRFTNLPLLPIYLIIQLLDLIKVVIGLVLVKKGVWVQNLVAKTKEA